MPCVRLQVIPAGADFDSIPRVTSERPHLA